jgi:hypothetical protein
VVLDGFSLATTASLYNMLQSTTSERYRLSKPRTITATTPSPINSKIDLNSPYPKQGSPATVGSQDSKSHQQVRQSLRDHLFGEAQSPQIEDLSEEEENESPIDGSKGIRKRISRTGTMISKRASFRLSLNPLSRSATSVTREQSAEPESEEDVIQQIKEKARQARVTALRQPVEVIIDEEGYEERIFPPTRKKSLFTPGLATRNPDDLLAKPPQTPVRKISERDYYYNPHLSENSPLSRIAALDLANRPFTPIARSATPADLDYGNLGGLGALRITNGVASPVPSVRSAALASRKSSATLRTQTDYFSLQTVRPTSRDFRPFLQEVRRSGEFSNGYQEYIKGQAAEISKVEQPIDQSPEQITPWPQIIPHNEGIEYLKKRSKSVPSLPQADRTSLIALNYMAEISDNPFTSDDNELMSPLEATTKPNEIEADLFEEQATQSRSSMESLRDGLDLPVIQNHASDFGQSTFQMLAKIGKSSSTLNVNMAESNMKKAQPTNIEANSKHSSSSSLQSLRKQPLPSKEKDVRPTNRMSEAERLFGPRSSLQDVIQPQRTSARPSPVTVSTTITSRSSVFTASAKNSSDTIPTIASTTSANTTNSKSSTPSKRLQKPRPTSMPPPSNRVTIQIHPDIEVNHLIPPIPNDVAERNARRHEELPPLEHTLPSVHHEALELEDMQPQPISDPVKFPTPSASIDMLTKKFSEHSAQRPKRNVQRRSFLGSFKRPERSSPPVEETYDTTETIMTLGDIAHSLGSSPYDIARTQGNPNPKSKPKPTNKIAPSLPRAKSMIGMSDHEAGELSRMRSSHRSASMSEEMDKIERQPPSPRNKHFNDRGGVPGKMPSPSINKKLPPLPAIPVAVQVKMREAELANLTTSNNPAPPRAKVLSSDIFTQNGITQAHASPDWTISRDTWAQHRKSAASNSAALTLAVTQPPHRSQQSFENANQPRWSLPPPSREVSPRRDVSQSTITSEYSQPSIKDSETFAPRRNLAIPSGTVARLAGRFEGGLGYGYEPGYGLGGSAGTRNMQSEASRKSVDVSKGYGIDLSDIPIFIAPHRG